MEEHGIGSTRSTIGTGYIGMPEKITRESYIEYVLNTEKVCIWTDSGEFIQDVPISIDLLNYLKFPRSVSELGSEVVWVNMEEHNNPIIVGILSKQDQSNFFKENQFKFERDSEGNIVIVSGDAKSASLLFSAKSISSSAKIVVKCIGDDSSEIDVISSGNVSVKSKSLIYQQLSGNKLTVTESELLYEDQFENLFKINSQGYWFKDINFKSYFLKIFDSLLNKFQVNTPYGPSGFCKGTPVGEVAIQELIDDLDSLNPD